ncbi:MAG: hypothetical protein OEV42_03390 [Deltaproteobacteria bacterium]|nr:hypothetical protein [Deltaproteobacteria bacterium]
MSLFTLHIDYNGQSTIVQVKASTARTAAIKWAENINIKDWNGIGEKAKSELVEELKDKENSCVLIEDTVNVWCSSALVRNRLFLINIVKTQAE